MHHIFADASAKKSCDGNTSKPNSFEKAGFVTSLHDTHTRVLFKLSHSLPGRSGGIDTVSVLFPVKALPSI